MKYVVAAILRYLGYEQLSVLLGYLRESGWLGSLRTGRPFDGNGMELPWYCYPAIHILHDRLDERNDDLRVFEFGSGNSTVWWNQRASHVVSVEDDLMWYQEVKRKCLGNVLCIHAASEDEYVQALHQSEGEFDIIVVDGRYRNRCMVECTSKLSTRGVILVDNSDWSSLAAGLDHLTEIGFRRIEFYGLAPGNGYPSGTSILYRSGNLLDL